MRSMRLLGLLFGWIAVAESLVEFDKSSLYDEKDFEGHDTVNVPTYCSESCHIYVSIPTDSLDVARNIFIQDFSGTEWSLFDVNWLAPDGKKTPYIVQRGNAQVNFLNKNDGFISAPIAVWIVRGDAPLFDVVEVYDGAIINRQTTPVGGIITILGVEPYQLTLTSQGISPPVISFIAITAGFDALDSPDKCTRVIREEFPDDYQDLHYAAVRSPLLTLMLSVPDTTTVMVYTEPIDRDTIDLGFNMFVASPGYIGCSVKPGNDRTKTFRSSLYAAETKAHFMSPVPVSVIVSSDLNTDVDHTVDIVEDGGAPFMWFGTTPDQAMNFNAQDLTITWTRNDDDLDQYFLIRVEPDNTPKTTTEEPEPEQAKTTTAEPELEPAKTTTSDPEPEPVKTTTAEPEPEPVITTTSEPEQEPVKTTTQKPEPEPIKTTTVVPEPEPVRTTTSEPEIVKSTTAEPEPEPIITTTDSEPEPEPIHTTTLKPELDKTTTTATRRTMQTTTHHPKSTVTGSTAPVTKPSTAPPTTSGTGYGSISVSVVLAVAIALRLHQ